MVLVTVEQNTNMKIVINACFGGFGISDAGYTKLIEWGVPVKAYTEQVRDAATGLYKPEPANEGQIIFDRDLTPPDETTELGRLAKSCRASMGRYWETWLEKDRTNQMLIRLVEEMGDAANGQCAKLRVVEIPDDVKWEIDEYDGYEKVAEQHRTWGE